MNALIVAESLIKDIYQRKKRNTHIFTVRQLAICTMLE
jgi:hypothetical protein